MIYATIRERHRLAHHRALRRGKAQWGRMLRLGSTRALIRED
jgi:hypothetical protein